jgi:predicted Zn-dependent protease
MTRRWRLVVPVVAALAGLAACTPVRNPATGALDYTAISPAQEQAIGDQEHPKILAEYGGAVADPKLTAYVDRVGQRLKAVSELPQQRFTFTVLDTPVANAFALPGGYVYVTRGLLGLANDEAELAGVLAHEIGHVTARHSAQRITQAQYGQLGTMGAAVLGGILLGGEGARIAGQAAQTAAQGWVQGYSREQEFEADQLGVRYLARAGYDPRGMASFLATLQGDEQLTARESGREARSGAPAWLASHPRTADRIGRAADAAAAASGGATLVRDRDRYLDAVDGLVWGNDPAQGLVQGRRFVHPVLGFAFEAPEGYRLRNGTSMVLGFGPEGRLMLFDGGKPADTDPLRYLTRDWLGGRPLEGVQALRLGANRAAVGFGEAIVNKQPRRAMFAVIDAADGRFWRFVFLDSRLSREAVARYAASLRSFRTLSASEARAIRPLRLQVVTVRPGDTAVRLAQRMASDGDRLARFRLINGLAEGADPRPGDRVKLIVRG